MEELINRYSPIVYFHKDETFFPSTIEYFLENSDLWEGQLWINRTIDGKRLKQNPTSKYLYEYSQTKFPNQTCVNNLFIVPRSKSCFYGQKSQLDQVPIYSFIKEKQDRYIIYYIFFYPFNEGKHVLYLQQIGDHEADLEHITVEVDKKSGNMLRVFYGSHCPEDGTWVSSKDVPIQNNKIVVYVAKGSHGLYPTPGYVHRFYGFANDLTSEDIGWTPKVQRIHLETDPQFNPNVDGWIYFKGRWGWDGICSIIDKGWFQRFDTEYPNLKPQTIYSSTSNIYYNISVYSLIISIIFLVIAFGQSQTRISKSVYYSYVSVGVIILAYLTKLYLIFNY